MILFRRIDPDPLSIEALEWPRPRWVREEDPKIQEVVRKHRDKGEEFEDLKPEDGFADPPWRQ